MTIIDSISVRSRFSYGMTPFNSWEKVPLEKLHDMTRTVKNIHENWGLALTLALDFISDYYEFCPLVGHVVGCSTTPSKKPRDCSVNRCRYQSCFWLKQNQVGRWHRSGKAWAPLIETSKLFFKGNCLWSFYRHQLLQRWWRLGLYRDTGTSHRTLSSSFTIVLCI